MVKLLTAVCPESALVEIQQFQNYNAFCKSVEYGKLEMTKFLVSLSPSDFPNMLEALNYFALKMSAVKGDLEMVKYLFSVCPKEMLLKMLKSSVYLAFTMASEKGHLEVMKFLVSVCTPRQLKEMLENDYFKALRMAEEKSQHTVVEYLIELLTPEQLENAAQYLNTLYSNLDFLNGIKRQRLDIRNLHQIDLDSVNNQLCKITSNPCLAKLLLTCKNLFKETGGLFCLIGIFVEIPNYVLGEKQLNSNILNLIELVQEMSCSKTDYAVNTPEFAYLVREEAYRS